jgi:hypothetical protein
VWLGWLYLIMDNIVKFFLVSPCAHVREAVMSNLGVENPPTYPDDHFDLIWSVYLDGSGSFFQTVQPANCTFPNIA